MSARISNITVMPGYTFVGEVDIDDLTTEEQRRLGIDPNDPAKYDVPVMVQADFSMDLFDDGTDPRLASTDAEYLVTAGPANILVPCGRFNEAELEAKLCRAYNWEREYEEIMESRAAAWEE